MHASTFIGRPRDTSKNDAIEHSSIELLREEGYQPNSIEGIALGAHVGTGTIYRHRKNKAELITDALHHYSFSNVTTIDTNSLRNDLIEIIYEKTMETKNVDGQLIAGLLIVARSYSCLASVITQLKARGNGVTQAAIFERAFTREEIALSAKTKRVLELISTVIRFRFFLPCATPWTLPEYYLGIYTHPHWFRTYSHFHYNPARDVSASYGFGAVATVFSFQIEIPRRQHTVFIPLITSGMNLIIIYRCRDWGTLREF